MKLTILRPTEIEARAIHCAMPATRPEDAFCGPTERARDLLGVIDGTPLARPFKGDTEHPPGECYGCSHLRESP